MKNSQQPQTTMVQENTVSQPKKNPTLPILLSGVALVTAILAGGFGYYLGSMQTSQTMLPNQEVQVSTIPQSNQIACTMEAKLCPDGSSVGRSGPNCEFAECPSSNENTTASEKEFINKKFGYSFTYTEYGEVVYLPKPTLTDDFVNISGLDSVVIQIEAIKTSEVDPTVWWSKQTVEPSQDKPTSCFSTQLVTEVKSFYEPEKTLTKFEQQALAIELKNTPGCADRSDHILIVPHKGKLLKITYDDATASEEILSTLKWL